METIEKYLYYYDRIHDRVKRKKEANPAFTLEKESYSKRFDRKAPLERASLFFPHDIQGKSILDFGCDDGGILLACRELGAEKVTGIDYNPSAIARAKRTVDERGACSAQFYCGDIENKAFLSTFEMADTVLLLALLGTSDFTSTESVIASACRFSKHALYYEGHYSPETRVRPLFDLLTFTDFTRFEYLGRHEFRILIRCSRDLMKKHEVPQQAVTSDDAEEMQYGAEEIYVLPQSKNSPLFSRKCRLIQYVRE